MSLDITATSLSYKWNFVLNVVQPFHLLNIKAQKKNKSIIKRKLNKGFTLRTFTRNRWTNTVLTMKYFSVGDCIQTFCVHILKFLINSQRKLANNHPDISHRVVTVYTSLIHRYSSGLR